MSRQRDVHYVSYPLIYVSKLFGYFPFSYNGQTSHKALKSSLPATSYAAILTVIIVTSYIFQLCKLLHYINVNTQHVISTSAHSVLTCINIITTILTQSTFLARKDELRKLFNCFSEYDAVLPTVKELNELNYSVPRTIILYHIVISSLFGIMYTVIVQVIRNAIFDIGSIAVNIFYLIVTFRTFLIDLHVINITQLIKSRLKEINVALIQLNMNICNMNIHGRCKITEFPYSHVNPRTLGDSYSRICDINELANTAYGIQSVTATCGKYISILANVYLLSLYILKEDRGSFAEELWYIPSCLALIWCTGHLAILIWSCHTMSEEANRTGVLVHKLLIKTKDPEIREELELFSLQLLHRKVQFTACGFFPLDFTLLYSIVGAVTTYLVILIQFQLSYNDNVTQNTTSTVLYSSTTPSYLNMT